MDILVKAAQLVLALVILVTVHEFGHYIIARIFGIKVERFYLFFNPKFSLLRYDPRKGKLQIGVRNPKDDEAEELPKALFTFNVGKASTLQPGEKPTWRDTIYGLGWLPLGGYCSIAGMIDETQDASTLASEPQPWEFRSKSAWKRLCVMIAGVCFNFILAIIIYTGISLHWGEMVIKYQDMSEGMDFAPELLAVGFENGDILTTLNGEEIEPASKVGVLWDLLQPGSRVGVSRKGVDVEVVIPETLIREIATKDKNYTPMSMRTPVVVAKLVNGEGAQKAGLVPGDQILTLGSDTVPTITEFLKSLALLADQTVPARIRHTDGTESVVELPVNSNAKIGIQMLSPLEIFKTTEISYGFFESIPRGISLGVDNLITYVSSLKLVFTKEGAQSLGGFGTLGDLFPNSWNWYSFWQITAFLSIILAFMNIIPIPMLDGGYTLFLLVEIITRRQPSIKFIERANYIGFFFLLLLMLYANGNDIYRLFIK